MVLCILVWTRNSDSINTEFSETASIQNWDETPKPLSFDGTEISWCFVVVTVWSNLLRILGLQQSWGKLLARVAESLAAATSTGIAAVSPAKVLSS